MQVPEANTTQQECTGTQLKRLEEPIEKTLREASGLTHNTYSLTALF